VITYLELPIRKASSLRKVTGPTFACTAAGRSWWTGSSRCWRGMVEPKSVVVIEFEEHGAGPAVVRLAGVRQAFHAPERPTRAWCWSRGAAEVSRISSRGGSHRGGSTVSEHQDPAQLHAAATEEEIRASSLQFVRKLSGFTRPSGQRGRVRPGRGPGGAGGARAARCAHHERGAARSRSRSFEGPRQGGGPVRPS